MDEQHADALNAGIEQMYEKYRDLDTDALLEGLSPEELAMLEEDLDREFGNPYETVSYRRPVTNYDIDEEYNEQEDAAALQKFLSHDPNHRFERMVPDHIRYLQDPSGFRPADEEQHQQSSASASASMPKSTSIQRPKHHSAQSDDSGPQMVNGREQIEISFYNGEEESSEDEQDMAAQQREMSRAINKHEMMQKHTHFPTKAETINLNQVTTKENVKIANDPGLRFQPSLRKTEQVAREPLPAQDYSNDGEEMNTNCPEDIVRRVYMNDPTLTEVNLNNIIGVPEDLYLALCEALNANTHVTKLNLANTGIKDRVAKAVGQVLKRNRKLTTVSVESNFITGDGAVAIVKALTINNTLRELRIDNQRHIFGQNVEQEFAKRLTSNRSLTKFGYSFANPGLRMSANNLVTRNVDAVRKERVQKERAAIARGEKPKSRVKPKINKARMAPQLSTTTLPKIITQEDAEISEILGKLDPNDVGKLQAWLQMKAVDPKNSGGEAPPPPPMGGMPEPKKPTRKAIFEEIKSGTSQLKNVVPPPEQKIVLPDPELPMPDDEKNRGILGRDNAKDAKPIQEDNSYSVRRGGTQKYQNMSERQYTSWAGTYKC